MPSITVGRVVQYRLSANDADRINYEYPRAGRNPVQAGQVCAAITVAVFSTQATNLQVFLDGTATYWATSRSEGDGDGQWSWPTAEETP